MKNTFLIVSFLINTSLLLAQMEAKMDIHEETYKETHKENSEGGWTIDGNVLPAIGQAAFNENWLGGGTSDLAIGLNASSAINYRKRSFIIDNEITVDYGIARYRGTDGVMRKTSDRFEVNSILGSQIGESLLYYSLILNFKTQFDKGYKYERDEFDNEIRTETSHILSPADIKLGPGILWKKNDHLSINFSPAIGRITIVDRDFTRVDPLDHKALEHYENHLYYGVEANKTSLLEFGAAIRAFSKFEVLKNVTMTNALELYSNYLEAPKNVDLGYTTNIVLMIGKHLSTSIVLETIYDDDAIGSLQIREAFGIGANYHF